MIVALVIVAVIVGYLAGRLALIERVRKDSREQELTRALADVVEAVMRNGVEMHPVQPGEIDTFEVLMEALQRAREVVRHGQRS
jgi:hypothetical protein